MLTVKLYDHVLEFAGANNVGGETKTTFADV